MPPRFLLAALSVLWMLGCGRLPAGATLEPAMPATPAVPSLTPAPTFPGTIVADFARTTPDPWQNLAFRPWHSKVDYRREPGPDGQTVMRATSEDAASMLVRATRVDLRQTPIVRWTWRVSGPVAGADERTRQGDDCAARVYFAWNLRGPEDIFRTEAIAYTWGQARPVGDIGPSAYTRQVGMVTLRSGTAGAGRWHEETRDLLADYRAFFRRDPPGPVSAIALMTDTDQTHGRQVGWYGPIQAFTDWPER